ncbi:MAG: sulfurtransferase complex subunit TusB [Burkholderiales bacterium]
MNKSPFEKTTLDSCLRVAGAGSALLLIEDAVYAATKGSSVEHKIRQAAQRLRVYALAPDLEARGIKNAALEGVTLVDYGGFVDLVAEHSSVQSWL